MALSLSEINSQLKNATKGIDTVLEQVSKANDLFDASRKIKLDITSDINSVVNGVKVLGANLGSAQSELKFIPAFGRLTSEIADIKSDLNRVVGSSSDKDKIDLVLGKTTATVAVLDDVITSLSPESIANNVKSSLQKEANQISSLLESLTSPALAASVLLGIDTSKFDDLISSVETFTTQVDDFIATVKKSEALINDLAENLTNNIGGSILALASTTIPDADLGRIYALIADDDTNAAFNVFKQYADLPDNVEEAFKNLKVDLSSNLKDVSSAVSTYVKKIGAEIDESSDTGTDATGKSASGSTWDFGKIKTKEEIEAVLRANNRSDDNAIAGIIVSWTETTKDQNITSEELHKYYIDKNEDGIPYHFLILRDGSLQRGRPLKEPSKNKFVSKHFLEIAFVGGYNAYSSEQLTEQVLSADSFTKKQWEMYDKFIMTFHAVFPYAIAVGDQFVSDTGSSAPKFDVGLYSEDKFGHRNALENFDPRWLQENVVTPTAILNEDTSTWV